MRLLKVTNGDIVGNFGLRAATETTDHKPTLRRSDGNAM